MKKAYLFKNVLIGITVIQVIILFFACKQNKNLPLNSEVKTKIVKITVNGITKEDEQIQNEMDFATVDYTCEKIDVSVNTEPKNAKISFANNTASENNEYEWFLNHGENKLTIVTGEGSKKSTYIVKVKRESPPLVRITTLKVNGIDYSSNISNKYNIHCGTTKNNIVNIECGVEPSNSKLSFADGIFSEIKSYTWNLENDGTNLLKITVKNGDNKTDYTLEIDYDKPPVIRLTSLHVDGIDYSDIITHKSTINLRETEKETVIVSCQLDPADTQISFAGGAADTEKTYNWKLTENETNNLEIILNKGTDTVKYTLEIYYKKIYDETKPNITFTISNDLGLDKYGDPLEETPISLLLGASQQDAEIQIDWGDGKEDFTLPTEDPSVITREVAAGTDVKIYGKLNHFNAIGNKFITKVSFYNCAKLKIVKLSQNKIAEIDLQPLPSLKELHITDNLLTEIDVSRSENLEELYCAWNNITELNLKSNPKLTLVTCYNTKIQELDISENRELQILTAGDNNYQKQINFDNNTKLTSIDLENCKLSNLDISKLTKLKNLRFKGNNLTEINLENNTALSYLDLGNNKLNNLNLDNLSELTELRVRENNLSNLNLSKNKKLNVIDLQNNNFTTDALNQLYTTMNEPVDKNNSFAVKGNPGASTSDTSIAQTKGWNISI